MITKVFKDEFKGHELFAVWEVDAAGNKVGAYPMVSLGRKKAAAITGHWDEFKQFAEEAREELKVKGK
jgi:hypothetical protein